MKKDEITKDTLLLILFIIILFVWQLAHILLATTKSISDFMSINHEQQTELTNVDKTKLTYPNDTQLANNNSTEINYTIRLVLANTDDSEKENDRTNI